MESKNKKPKDKSYTCTQCTVLAVIIMLMFLAIIFFGNFSDVEIASSGNSLVCSTTYDDGVVFTRDINTKEQFNDVLYNHVGVADVECKGDYTDFVDFNITSENK